MCEYDPECTKVTDPLARALSENPRERDAALLVICPLRYHLLAAVYDLPERGRVLCTPAFKFRHGSLFMDPEDPDALGHLHPGLELVSAYSGDEVEYGRCHCHTWSYRPSRIPEMIAAYRDGRVLPPGDLVKVEHSNGQITKMGREWAERNGERIVGTVTRSPRTLRPYLMGNYVKMADTPRE